MSQPEVFRLIALKQGLKLLQRGIKPNSAWTPKATMQTAERLTGGSFKRGGRWDYPAAIAAIEAKLIEMGVNQ